MNYVQIVVWKFLGRPLSSDVLGTKQALRVIVFIQYIPRFVRFIPLTSEVKKSAGVFAESAWAGAAYYLLWYMLSSHVSILQFYVILPLVNKTINNILHPTLSQRVMT